MDPQPFEDGATVTIESAPDPALVGQSGTVKSHSEGLFYLIDVNGTASYHPDANLSGERPASGDPAPAPPPPADPMAARALAAAGGTMVAGQLTVATASARWARLRALVPSAKTDDEAEGFLRAAALELPALRAAEANRKAEAVKAALAAEDAERGELLVQAIAKTGRPRTDFLALDAAGNVTGPAPGYTRAELPIATLRAQVARMGGSGAVANIGGNFKPANGDEAGLAERARASGMTVEERRAAEANQARCDALQQEKGR